ncbi:TPA: hypothetical protein DIS56_03445 [Candidatus Saccharibacteria bacterium]|nr:MAG: hypothetical protein UX30_C0005G0064 [Candidatus Saccharibacteria bacterium GW2011_GWA2_46_10]OGL34918.1 MAG: hypothetical protein A3F05_02200 [Candidatus Saccharibacteria bacterium RIFCSPHIGHO2_12_FULL_47_17]HCM52156.1 hypothetical protein [Candidatus Saccharibacteria bacterium]
MRDNLGEDVEDTGITYPSGEASQDDGYWQRQARARRLVMRGDFVGEVAVEQTDAQTPPNPVQGLGSTALAET